MLLVILVEMKNAREKATSTPKRCKPASLTKSNRRSESVRNNSVASTQSTQKRHWFDNHLLIIDDWEKRIWR